MSRVNLQRSRLRRPYPLSWPSTEYNYSFRLENVTERSNVEFRDSTFLQYVNPPYVNSTRTSGPPIVPSDVPEPLAHRDQQQAPLKRIAIHPEVQGSHDHLKGLSNDNTSPPLIGSKAESLAASIRIWTSASPQIAALRNQILAERIEVNRERSWYHQQEEETRCIMERFMDVINISTAEMLDPESRSTLNQLSKELKRRHGDLSAVRVRVTVLENNLSNHEYQLQRLEEDAYIELNKESRQNEHSSGPPFQSSSTHTIIPSDSGFDESAGLRDRLYSRMGDLRIHLERLNNFEYDLREELEERNIARASGQADITSDIQFFEQIKDDRAKIRRDLQDAQTDVHELKEQCIREGIDFEEPELPDVLYQTEMEDDSPTFDSPMYQPDAQQGSSSIIGAFFNAQERVKRWLKEPSGLQNMEDEGTPEIPDKMTRIESSSLDKDWVWTPSPTQRAASIGTGGEHECAAHSAPKWRSGPPAGSQLLEALLLESAMTPLGAEDQS